MKKILGTALAVALLSPMLAFAAYNDVSLTTSTVIATGGVNLTVTGSTASIQSLVVRSSDFDVTLLPGSSIAISSADKVNFNFDSAVQITQSFSCGSGSSSLTISNVSGTATLTITPTGTCGTTTTTSSGGGGNGSPVGGGGGGGGGYAAPVSAPANAGSLNGSSLSDSQIRAIISLLQSFGTDAATIANVTAALHGQATAGTAPSAHNCSFTRDLTLGSRGDDVICLQNALIAAGYPVPAGATGYFGAQTRAAVAQWQSVAGVTPAAGYFGPKSQAAFQAGH